MNHMKFQTVALLSIISWLAGQASEARGGGGHGGGGGGGFHSAPVARSTAGGGGGYARAYEGNSRNFSTNTRFDPYRDRVPDAGFYGNYGSNYGTNRGTSAVWGSNTYPWLSTPDPPFAQADPLADYYRDQAAASQAAQQGGVATVNTYILPNQGGATQTQLPTDFGGAQGTSVSRDAVVSVDEGNLVRDNFHGSGLFTNVWWKNYKNAWFNPAWTNDWVWNNVDWDTIVAFWRGSAPSTPADYEFGSNITFQNGQVLYGDKPMMTSEEYYHQAQLLAAKGAYQAGAKGSTAPHKVPQIKDWAQFGVFSLIPAGDKFSTEIFQLAVNRDGKVRGNCYNVMNDQLDKVEGEVDKSNSRVCFTVGKNRTVVYDTGLGNLLSAQSPILIHLDKDRSQQRAFVRLNQSKL
jgi:hypothetical protein